MSRWVDAMVDRWAERDPPPSPMAGRACSTPLREAFEEMDRMRQRFWAHHRHKVKPCRDCGARIVFLKRMNEKRKKYVPTPVDVDPAVEGSARPWEAIFRNRHRRHTCPE